MYKVILLLFINTFFCALHAQDFTFNTETKRAYDAIMALRIDEGLDILQEERVRNPDNLAVDFIADYADFFTLLIQEKESDYHSLKDNRDDRLSRIKMGPKDSPYYKYCQAEVYLHWALARSKFGEYFNSFLDVKKAFGLLKQNEKQFPDFKANQKSLGLLHAMVGTIPESYRWGAHVLGLNGTVEQGFNELNGLIQYSEESDFFFEDEALLFYTYLLLHLKKEDDVAWKLIEDNSLNVSSNLLNHFVAANIAMHTGHNDRAIELLMNRPSHSDFMKFDYLNLMLGEAKLYRGDQDADLYLEKFVNEFEGIHFIKDAYQKIAWFKLLQNDVDGYHRNMQRCLTQGAAVADADKKALKDSQSGKIPNIDLLRARLLFDGGYYIQAQHHLSKLTTSDFIPAIEELELTYRKGRIEDALNNTDEAIRLYQSTLNYQGEEKTYFPANASLMLGLIYEKKNEINQAEWYYKNCLRYSGHEYKNSIDQKAKTGLSRLKD